MITEAPLGTAPLNRHFPRRNRLIAGLTLGCVVVEAAPKSGTLITARLVGDYGRELFAVPGSPLDPRCRGSNDLLRNGAILTESVADILPHLPPVLLEQPVSTRVVPHSAPEPALPRRPEDSQARHPSFSFTPSDSPETEGRTDKTAATSAPPSKSRKSLQNGAFLPLQATLPRPCVPPPPLLLS